MDKIKILLVEDDLVERNHVETLLSQMGCEVVSSEDNTLDALTSFCTNRPDLVLADIGLKNGDSGIDLVHRLNSIAKVPVIFLTANDTDDVFNLAKATGPYAYISKPAEPKNLERHIDLVFQRFELEKEDDKPASFGEDLTPCFYTKIGNKLKKISIPEISSVEVEGKYSCITIASHNYHIKISLTDLLAKLPSKTFIRVSRKHLVNLEMITDIDLQEQLIVAEGKRISFSRSYREVLMKQIDLI